MPLYDYHCHACGLEFSKVVALGATAVCVGCQAPAPSKKVSLFAFCSKGEPAGGKHSGEKQLAGATGTHVHSAGCGCHTKKNQATLAGHCAAETYADALIKKHLGS